METNSYEFGSEKHALFLEKEEWEYHEKYDKYLKDKKAFIDGLFEKDDTESRIALLRLLTDEEFVNVCGSENDFAGIIQIIRIFSEEIKSNESRTILDLVHGENNIIFLLNTLKFILFRIEFADEKEGLSLLNELHTTIPISECAIRMMVDWCCVDKNRVLNLTDMKLEG